MQIALELATAHHSTATSLERLLSHKGEVTEAKMRQQARLCASLDARLNAAHTTIDAAATETRGWLQSADCVLQALARQLSGMAPPGTTRLFGFLHYLLQYFLWLNPDIRMHPVLIATKPCTKVSSGLLEGVATFPHYP